MLRRYQTDPFCDSKYAAYFAEQILRKQEQQVHDEGLKAAAEFLVFVLEQLVEDFPHEAPQRGGFDDEKLTFLEETMSKLPTGLRQAAAILSARPLTQCLADRIKSLADEVETLYGQLWFWTREWQAKETASEAELAAEQGEIYDNMNDLIKSLS